MAAPGGACTLSSAGVRLASELYGQMQWEALIQAPSLGLAA